MEVKILNEPSQGFADFNSILRYRIKYQVNWYQNIRFILVYRTRFSRLAISYKLV
jgi:hypothetical protein